jgi:hypothetical protein
VPHEALSGALADSFGRKLLKEGFNCRYPAILVNGPKTPSPRSRGSRRCKG